MNLTRKPPNTKKQNRAVALALAGSLLLVLPACQIPRLRQSESVLGLPADYSGANFSTSTYNPFNPFSENLGPNVPANIRGANSSENSAQLSVDEFYNDPTLSRLINQALASNQELKMLEEEIQIARAEVLRRQGAYFPFLTLGGNVGLDKSSRFTRDGAVDSALDIRPGQPIHNPLPNFQGTLNFLWHPDIWRELRNTRDAAIQRYRSTIERRNAFVTRLVADVAENYYGLMALDKRLEVLDQTIAIQEQSYKFAKNLFDAGRLTELPVQRFLAEVRKNQSEKLIVYQEIVEVENRINFLAGRTPQPVERVSAAFLDLNINVLSVGVPSQLLLNRPDIRQAERELEATGFEIKVARAHFFPSLDITAGIGYRAFNPKYLFYPEALIAGVAGDMVAPLINKKAIQAEFISANAKQLESLYNYQRVILNAFTEVINRVSMVENYRKSIEIKRKQLDALDASVVAANNLFQAARAEYVEVLLAQRDRLEARTVLIQTKRQQLSAIVNAYQAIGGGNSLSIPAPPGVPKMGHWGMFKTPLVP